MEMEKLEMVSSHIGERLCGCVKEGQFTATYSKLWSLECVRWRAKYSETGHVYIRLLGSPFNQVLALGEFV